MVGSSPNLLSPGKGDHLRIPDEKVGLLSGDDLTLAMGDSNESESGRSVSGDGVGGDGQEEKEEEEEEEEEEEQRGQEVEV